MVSRTRSGSPSAAIASTPLGGSIGSISARAGATYAEWTVMPMPSCWACHTCTPGTISSMARIVPEEEVTLRDGARVLIRPVQPNHSMLALFEDIGEVEVHDRGMGQIEIDVELPCDRARGLADALRAAAKGLVRLRP